MVYDIFLIFMIFLSLQAGLATSESPEQLLIALEPEAASIYCRKLRLHQVIDLSLRPMTNGLDLDGSRPFDSSFRQGKKNLLLVPVFGMTFSKTINENHV